ncbi:LPS-assembly protein LptD [Paracoccus kondratievae]
MLAALLPGAALGQSLTPDGQTLPVYGQTEEVQKTPAGPALAPTESPDQARRFADGTEASHTPVVSVRPGSVRITGSGEETAADPATLLADEVMLSADNKLTASGGVVIWYRGARLVASRVVYDNATGAAVIEGPIHLTEPARSGTPDETILIADSAQLDPNLQDGILRGARLVLAREMQMAAREMRRSENGNVTRLDNVVASSCQICAEDPIPLWEIRARSITHDRRTRKLHFERPQLRALGLPVATLPWLTAPDPSVERMTGFLRPQFRTTSGLGFGIKLPYFITLGDHADITLTPISRPAAPRRWNCAIARPSRMARWNGTAQSRAMISNRVTPAAICLAAPGSNCHAAICWACRSRWRATAPICWITTFPKLTGCGAALPLTASAATGWSWPGSAITIAAR